MNTENEKKLSGGRNDAQVARIRKVTLVGLGFNVLLTVLKAIGGVVFRSQALLADAVHSLSDLATDLAVIFGVKYWSAPPDESHTPVYRV